MNANFLKTNIFRNFYGALRPKKLRKNCLFSVNWRLPGVASAKTGDWSLSRRGFLAKGEAILFFFLLVFSVQAAELYHTNRTFTAVAYDLQGTPPADILNAETKKLTNIVKGAAIKIDTTNTHAIEKQVALPICYESAVEAWDAAVNYGGTSLNYQGKTYDNVGWVRGTKSTTGGWGAYLWVLQNRIAFQSSTSYWWRVATNGFPVAITNVMVGSLGIYGPMSNVVDIGPVIPTNYPGADQSDSGTYQVDITNVFYELVIPDIWITPRNVVTCVGGEAVQFTVMGTNIPQGVTWTINPEGVGATIQTNSDWHYAEVTPGNVATNYKVRSTSVDNTNFYNETDFTVLKVDITESNIYVAVSNTTTLHLTPDSTTNTSWEIIPELQNGAYIEGADSGTSVVINAGSLPTNYTIKAYAEDLDDYCDTCSVTVVKIDLDTDTDNNGTIESNDSGEDQYEEYAPGRILCVDGFGISTNTDYLAEIKLAIQPTLTNGTAKLEAIEGGSRIKVWTSTNKTTEITLPKTYDLISTNPPSSLFVDGVATGKVQLGFSYTAESGGFTCTDQVAMLIIPTISYAPGKAAVAYVWAPLKTDFNNNSGNNLGWDDATEFETQIEDQGWPSVTWLEDTTGDTDTNFGSCTLANYKGMTNCGIYTIVSHGETGGHHAVYAAYSAAGLSAISNWCAGETGITIDPWDPDPTDTNWLVGCYVARVSSAWLSANWKSAMNANRAISFWSICFSAASNSVTGEDSVKECAGGRWRVGYINTTSESEVEIVNERILTRMNGNADNARKRTAGEAYENGNGYTNNVKMDGNDWTTLCPAPLADNAVFPDITAENRKGWGCIIFDTYMSQSYSANDALLKQNGCPTSNHRWFGNADGKYGLSFDFDKTGGAATTMRGVADKCLNDGNGGGRKLDGDRVKPNEDNRDWSF